MHLARSAERRIEQLVERVAGFIFPGQLHPNELGARIVRAADLHLTSSPYGDEAPNWFQIRVNPEEVTKDLPIGALETTLAAAMEEHSAERGWRLLGPVQVSLDLDSGVSRSKVSVVPEFRSGQRPAWATLSGEPGEVAVRNNRSVLGRGESCDAVIADETVSRIHALLYRENQAIWLTDLGSANGTFHQTGRVSEPHQVLHGDVITLGSVPLRVFVSGEERID
jgi:hypothetical protein